MMSRRRMGRRNLSWKILNRCYLIGILHLNSVSLCHFNEVSVFASYISHRSTVPIVRLSLFDRR